MKRYFFFAVLIGLAYSGQTQKAVKGLLDLSGQQLEGQCVALSGEWEFFWNELASPVAIDTLSKDYFQFPSLWNGAFSDKGIELSAQGFATYRLRVVLPASTPDLALSLGDYYTSYKLFYNGFEFQSNGKVGTTKEETNEDWLPKTVSLGRYSDTLTFVLQIANFRHSKGGSREPIVLGDRKVLMAKRDFDFSYDFLLSGSLIMGGLFFLGLFLFGQHEKSVLFFALFCITFSYRLIGSGEYAFHALFPDMAWNWVIRAEYLALFVPTGIFAIYSYLLYPEDSKKWLLLGFSIVAALFALLSLFAPPIFFTRLVEPYFVMIVLGIFYLIYVYWQAYRKERIGAQYAFASTGIVFMVAVYLISVYLTGAQENTFITFIGFILFFFFQSLILSFRFAYSLRQAKDSAETASKAKTEFLSTISHEIRTPLNAVVGISHYLANENPRPDQKESLESLQFSAEHLTALINDILDYNKLESGAIEFEQTEVNLKALSQNITKTHLALAREKGLSLILDFDASIHSIVVADSTRIYQVLNNLLSNALKFTAKGYVKLKVSRVFEAKKIQTIRVEVSDSGIGIPSDKLGLIFDRFTQAGSSTTREYGGTGLGLAIIKKILNLVGSEIFVKSEEGKGTVFWFDISFLKVLDPIVSEEIQEEQSNNILSGKSILLVEDNQMNILVAKKFLAKWNLQVDIANNGQEAIEKVKSGTYDLVLMDLQMPVMDGYKATRHIRSFNKEVPIIALTASALLKVRQDVLSAGMNDYITKPFNPDDLKRKITQYISAGQ